MPAAIRRPANRLTSIKPAPKILELDAPSMYSFHMLSGSSSSSVVSLASFSLLSAVVSEWSELGNIFEVFLQCIRGLTELILSFEAARYITKASPLIGAISVGNVSRSEISFTFKGLALIPCIVMRCPINGPS
ncbi:hypothetical protein Tco_0381328 [Tanacetum coccineum]